MKGERRRRRRGGRAGRTKRATAGRVSERCRQQSLPALAAVSYQASFLSVQASSPERRAEPPLQYRIEIWRIRSRA